MESLNSVYKACSLSYHCVLVILCNDFGILNKIKLKNILLLAHIKFKLILFSVQCILPSFSKLFIVYLIIKNRWYTFLHVFCMYLVHVCCNFLFSDAFNEYFLLNCFNCFAPVDLIYLRGPCAQKKKLLFIRL